MIRVKDVSFTYENAVRGAALGNITVDIPPGQAVLLCGESGSGKTTFGRLVNGLIPSYYEGKLEGTVLVGGKDTRSTELHELTPHVGSVFQNPKSQFYTLQTDTEIVFACENIGLEKEDILSRFDRTVASLQIESLLGKSLFALSGGEKQKIAFASAGALLPDILVLDEPTSNLDIGTIRDLQRILHTWKAQGKTILIAEHRLAWLRGIVDRVLLFKNGQIAEDLDAGQLWQRPAAQLNAAGLRAPAEFAPVYSREPFDAQAIEINGFRCTLGGNNILNISNAQIPKGAVVAVLGDNGAGKTTFARCLCGLVKKAEGTLRYGGKVYNRKARTELCYMVMQDVNHQLFSESVVDEVLLGAHVLADEQKALAEKILADLDLLDCKDAHPMALSGGQRQRVAIASAIASQKEIIVFDEPTSGLDYRHMKEVAGCICKLAGFGKTQFVITHDPELVAACCNYYLFMDAGAIVQGNLLNMDAGKYITDYFDI